MRQLSSEARARDQEVQAKQEELQKNILNFLRSKGYDDAKTIFFFMHYLKLIVLYYTWKSIFAFYNLYVRSCDFNSLVWLLLMYC